MIAVVAVVGVHLVWKAMLKEGLKSSLRKMDPVERQEFVEKMYPIMKKRERARLEKIVANLGE